MGVYVNLTIVPSRIAPEAWQEAYEESLALLRGYSGEMMGIQFEQINSTKRRVYSRRIEHHIDDPKQRHWHVVGDFASKETGESFILYSDLEHYRDRGSHSKSEGEINDIIVNIIEEKGGCRDVFSDKTQGYPYHIPLLAVAMLVEDRFPKYAHASGDIDIHQAKQAQAFAKTVLKRKIALPLAVDASRLFQRLQAHYQGKEALAHFDRLFRGDSSSSFEILYKLSDRSSFSQNFLDDLRYYKSPTQLGAIDLSMKWLNATRDLRTLCELACLNDDGPNFDPVQFADALASTWISIEESLRGLMNPFRKPKGATDTVATQFGSMLFDMGGLKGRNMRFYMDEKQVLEILAGLFPGQAKQIEQIFTTETETIRKNLANSQKGVETLVKRSEADPEIGDGSSFRVLKSAENLSQNQRLLLEGMAYALSLTRAKFQEEDPGAFQEAAERMHEQIVRISHHQGITLTEDAWKWIDRENDLELLRFVLMLVLIKNDEQKFWNMRKGLLENRNLCQAVLEMTHDQKLLARIAKKIEATN
ncbi:hypothetical protein L0337_28855 [candidate division KSB1 bacterium]|nr:hypothetical protein [candidate division KSB1 bacterium]